MTIVAAKMKFFNACIAFVLLLALAGPLGVARANHTDPPQTVTIAGTFQDELGCLGAWLPDCDKTFLTYDAEDDIWQASFGLPANADEKDQPPRYKVALNGSWGENYGADANQGGADIPLAL
jgi:pullulanase-like protein